MENSKGKIRLFLYELRIFIQWMSGQLVKFLYIVPLFPSLATRRKIAKNFCAALTISNFDCKQPRDSKKFLFSFFEILALVQIQHRLQA